VILPQPLSASDLELVEAARDVIRRNYDAASENHTVGSAVRCASGRVYVGVNVYSLHGSCAEFIAIGSAITAGEREFVAIASARGADGSELLPPCGNCRQMLCDYSTDCDVIIEAESGPVKVKVSALLPYSYDVE
jgi:cytidine deaminase